MYTLRTYNNHPFKTKKKKTFYEDFKKLSKYLVTFSFFYKKISKIFINIYSKGISWQNSININMYKVNIYDVQDLKVDLVLM